MLDDDVESSPDGLEVTETSVSAQSHARGRPTLGARELGHVTSSLNYKVKSLSMLVNRLDNLKISVNKEGNALQQLLQIMTDEANNADNDPTIRQRYHQNVLDAMLRVHELHTKAASDCFDLETKRSDLRLKRQLWKHKVGIKKVINAGIEDDSMAEVAALMRGK